MAKNKKKPAITGKLSPESYVKTQARKLAIVECHVSADWESTGMCSVLVVRRHVTGNFTVGLYMVDLYCLGLKDTMCRFNISPGELSHLMGQGQLIECDYVLAHNIIYGAIEFAGEYGFLPHKDFAVTRFILEEDDEAVEVVDIEFGLDGQPCYMRGPYESDARVKQISAILEANAGPGNYSIIGIGGGYENAEGDFREDDNGQLLAMLDMLNEKYNELVRRAGTQEEVNDLRIGMDFQVTGEPMESEYVSFDSVEEENAYLAFYEMITNEKRLKDAIKGLNKAILTYPGKAVFYNLLQSAYMLNGEKERSMEILYEMRRQFPGYLYAKIAYANVMLEEGRPDEAIDTFDGLHDLHLLYPSRELFHESEAIAFWSTMCNCLIAKGDVDTADAYMNAILRYELQYLPNQSAFRHALTGLCNLKADRLKEFGVFDPA